MSTTFAHCHFCGEAITISQPIVTRGSYTWHATCAPEARPRACAAWRDCGNTAVPLDQLSFRGFCPSCERIANTPTCCFEHCHQLATRKLGGDVYFPVCDQHAEALA